MDILSSNESQKKTTFKQFPKRDWLAQIGTKIIANNFETDSLTFAVRPKSKQPITCHLFAKHEDAVQILGPSLADRLDLSHYDRALASGGGGAEFFISATNKSTQWQLLKEAFSLNPTLSRNVSENCPRAFFDIRVDEAVTTAIKLIEQNSSTASGGRRTYDTIQDYGYLVTYLLVRDIVGLKMPRRPSFAYRLFKLAKKLRKKDLQLIRIPEIDQANELVFWIEVMFGHLFMNPGNHNKLLMVASTFISKRYIKTIKASMAHPTSSSLIHRMQESDLAQTLSEKVYNQLVINIVMELVGSFQYLIGRAFAGVIQTIDTAFADSIAPSVDTLGTFNARMTINARATLDEAMRHNSPTGFILRAASTDFFYKGVQVAKGDLLCVLCNIASKDPSVFKTPEDFYDTERALKHQNDYLAFGSPDFDPAEFQPRDAHHPCFGQYMARVILTKMLKGLENLPRENTQTINGNYAN